MIGGTVTLHSVVRGLCVSAVLMLHGGQASGVSAARDAARAADMVAIEKLRQQDIAATLSRDPVALTDLWTDDAIRIGVGQPADVGRKAIGASNDRQMANKSFKVLSYISEVKDFTFLDGGWAVEWRTFTASYVESPGAEVKQIRGTVLGVWKRLPDGSWKAFRGMGGTESPIAGKAGGS